MVGLGAEERVVQKLREDRTPEQKAWAKWDVVKLASQLLEEPRQEDCAFKARLGNLVKPCFKIETWVRGLAQ